jgi:hypothetical protein
MGQKARVVNEDESESLTYCSSVPLGHSLVILWFTLKKSITLVKKFQMQLKFHSFSYNMVHATWFFGQNIHVLCINGPKITHCSIQL